MLAGLKHFAVVGLAFALVAGWLLTHFDCKRYLNRDLKGRNPFEVTTQPPEFFDLRLT